MIWLGIDTATSAIAAAVVRDSADPISLTRLDPRGHTERLAPLISQALQQAGVAPGELTAIAAGTGPGPFTGLRVGLVTATTMGHALAIPVVGVCSLDAIALAAARTGQRGDLLVATDARRKEVYYASYHLRGDRPDQLTRTSQPAVVRPAELPTQLRNWPSAGRGPLLYPELFGQPVPILDVDAADLVSLAREADARGQSLPANPQYLRRPDAVAAW